VREPERALARELGHAVGGVLVSLERALAQHQPRAAIVEDARE
jgi:hypothetical protein